MGDAVDVLTADGVRLGVAASDRWEAVRQAGALLVELGAVEDAYAPAMLEREELLSSYVGEGFAIPHGTDEARALVRRTTLAFLQYPDGVDWDGQTVHACVAIAADADEHVGVMGRLARVLLDAEQADELRTTTDPQRVLALLTTGPAPDRPHEEA